MTKYYLLFALVLVLVLVGQSMMIDFCKWWQQKKIIFRGELNTICRNVLSASGVSFLTTEVFVVIFGKVSVDLI